MKTGEWMKNDPGQNGDASSLPFEGTRAVFCWWSTEFLPMGKMTIYLIDMHL